MPGKASDRRILRQGDTCWRIATAGRAAVLVDAAAYYQALRSALAKAQRSVFIVGWDVDSRTRLVGPGNEPGDGRPAALGAYLTHLVEQRPELRVHILLWDFSLLYALEREPVPTVNLDWSTPAQISVCLDDVLPAGASHHQKIVVIDDAVAFCGGLDLTIRRWDTPAHRIDNDRRVDPKGAPYRPFHDVQMLVDGDAAAALGELVRRRWQKAACEKPKRLETLEDPWPDDVAADFSGVPVGIARTLPEYDGQPEIREVEAQYVRSVQSAEGSIYIENQFLTAKRVADALAERMRENTRLEVLIVAPNIHHSWLEERSMNAGRLRFMERLRRAGAQERVHLCYPALPDDDTGEGAMVHAKVMIVDDRLLRVGSSNLNNRSMGMDTECDLTLEVDDAEQRRAITRIRNRLLAEHTGAEVSAVADAISGKGLLAAARGLSDGARCLRPIDLSDVPNDELARTFGQLADPERPIATPSFVGDMFGGQSRRSFARLWRLIGAAAAVMALVLLWRYTPLAHITDPRKLMEWLQSLGSDLWMPLAMPAVYVLGGLVVFPVTVLIAVTGMMFSPALAFTYALVGTLLSAALTYGLGRAAGRGPLRGLMGPRVNRISRALANRGVLSVAALRMLPLAPFSVVNVVAGASHIRFADYMLGTLAGMGPGILLITALGHQLAKVLSDPQPVQMLLLVLCLLGWLALSLGLQLLVSRMRSRDDE